MTNWLLFISAAVGFYLSIRIVAGADDPSTFLYDAPEGPAGDSAANWLAQRNGWLLLDEDDKTHALGKTTVLLNDKIVAVLPANGGTLDVYSRQTVGAKLCARLEPRLAGASEVQRRSLAIRENDRGAIALDLGLRSPAGQTGHITFALTAGAPFVKTSADGVEKLRVHAPCRWAVLPDFFGDDIAIDASTIPAARAELPSENFFLEMLHAGDALLMTVSESRENEIEVALGSNSPRQIVASDISYGKQPHIWVGLLAAAGIWHERPITLEDADQILALDWQMPFPALWRVDWSTADKLTDSWEMLLQEPGGKYVMQDWFGQDEAFGQRFGKEFGDRDWNKPGRIRWNPVLGSFTFPCWVDNHGHGYLQPLKQRRYTEHGPIFNFSGPALIYPMDRIKSAGLSTPLESLTIVDMVRMTLGVGPCQYILDLEGQKRNSRGVATCYARDVINAIYANGTQLQSKATIEEQLDAAVAFIRNVRERIDEYVAFGRQMTSYLEDQKRLHPGQAAFIDDLLTLTARLDQLFNERKESIYTPDYARQNAEVFREKLLSYTEQDAATKCAAQMAVFTSIGGAQDGLVASCRMIVKTLRQRAGMAMTTDPELKSLATEIRARTHAMLRNATPYEAPRH
jgi:hypothetical protein